MFLSPEVCCLGRPQAWISKLTYLNLGLRSDDSNLCKQLKGRLGFFCFLMLRWKKRKSENMIWTSASLLPLLRLTLYLEGQLHNMKKKKKKKNRTVMTLTKLDQHHQVLWRIQLFGTSIRFTCSLGFFYYEKKLHLHVCSEPRFLG